jgi:sphinganine-1-phosphate aldolase
VKDISPNLTCIFHFVIISVIPETVHAAFYKACFYVGVEVRKIQINTKTVKIDPAQMKKEIDSNTIMLVGSAPEFSFG